MEGREGATPENKKVEKVGRMRGERGKWEFRSCRRSCLRKIGHWCIRKRPGTVPGQTWHVLNMVHSGRTCQWQILPGRQVIQKAKRIFQKGERGELAIFTLSLCLVREVAWLHQRIWLVLWLAYLENSFSLPPGNFVQHNFNFQLAIWLRIDILLYKMGVCWGRNI